MIDNNPWMSRTVVIRNFHIWKLAASFSSDGISYRRLDPGIGLDDVGAGEGGNGTDDADIASVLSSELR